MKEHIIGRYFPWILFKRSNLLQICTCKISNVQGIGRSNHTWSFISYICCSFLTEEIIFLKLVITCLVVLAVAYQKISQITQFKKKLTATDAYKKSAEFYQTHANLIRWLHFLLKVISHFKNLNMYKSKYNLFRISMRKYNLVNSFLGLLLAHVI